MSFFKFGKAVLRGIAKTIKQNAPRTLNQHAANISEQSKQLVLRNDNGFQQFWTNFSFRGVYSNSIASHMRRASSHGFLRRNAFKFPMFAFVGLCMQEDNGKEVASIADLYSFINSELQLFLKDQENTDVFPSKFSEYDIGERLGKPSANAAVYSASHHGKEVALKIMFNYEIPSNAAAIFKAFQREYQVLPCTGSTKSPEEDCVSQESGEVVEWNNSNSREYPSEVLSEHPNVMKLYGRFIDKMPLLHDSIDSYPGALPTRLYSRGFGRNQTMCLVMPKFTCSLREHLHNNELTDEQKISLVWQLLEGVAHLERNRVAHRDLKSDNLLIDSYGDGYQRLVITDFGSCLASEDMHLPYETHYVDKGGNVALMAPEIINAVPKQATYLDYTKADAWTCGTIAYEIFHKVNPFYAHLCNSDYEDRDLKNIYLNSGNEVIDKVILGLVRRDPAMRLTACKSATLLALNFNAPSEWLKYPRDVTESDVDNWLLVLSINVRRDCKLMGDERFLPPDILMKSVFLSRTSSSQIMDALILLSELKKSDDG